MKDPSRKGLRQSIEDRSSTETSLNFYNDKMDEEYIIAAKTGDLDKIKSCLQSGVDLNLKNPGGLSALHLAARENHPDIVSYLIAKGIDLKAITKRLNTPLHIASLGGHEKVVKILLRHGCAVNPQAEDDMTPLYMAAQENHIGVVNLLLENAANLHLAAKGDFEPSDIAVLQGHTKVAIMLLEHNSKGLRALHAAAKRDDPAALQLLSKDHKNLNERISNGYTPLHIAAKHDSIKAANYLIDHKSDLNATAKHNVVPLHVAARHGQIRVLTGLIEAGANLDAATKDGLTALHCAAREGHDLCVELLLVHGAPITAKTKHGLTALHMASQGNHTDSANHILAHGAHIDDTTLDGVTPLHVTAHYGHVETAKLLIEKGTDIDCRAKNGYTALHVASKKNREPIVQLLLKHKASVHIKNNNGQTALHVAAYFGHVNIVLLLLQEGASLEATTIRKETVLHVACRTTQIQIVRLLLRNGAKVNPKSKDDDTPLHNACRQSSSSMVSLLLDNEANPDIVNKEGCTPLHLACRDGDEKAVESMLDRHANVSILSKRGFTPLHEAAKHGHVHIIQHLLEGKANVNAKGKNNLTPLHIACHYDKPEAAVKLLNSDADPHVAAKNGFTPLHITAKKNQINLVTLLLERGVEADLTTKNGVSPLHLAAQEGNPEVVDELLEGGASPGVQTTNGLTPLHIAVHYNRIEVVQRLLKYGANINSPTQSGFTPLHLAAMYGHTDVAEMLLKDGADVEPKTKNGNTPLHIAAYKGHNDIVELLLKYNAPPNALNKDGYSALYIAESLQQTVVVVTLTRVTKVTSKPKNKSKEKTAEGRLEQVHRTFLKPEALEEALLVEAGDEVEDEVHIQKKIVQEDFDESFAGLDERRSTLERSDPQVNEAEIQTTLDQTVESMDGDYEDFLKNLEKENESIVTNVSERNNSEISSSADNIANDIPDQVHSAAPSRDVRNMNYPDNVYITEPPKQGTFLTAFYVDARGGSMESKQSGVKIIIPRGAVTMPTRITCSQESVDRLPKLNTNESLASHVLNLSPGGEQFLKPVILEVPHFAALRETGRELIVLRCDAGHSHWKEHVSALVDDESDGSDEKAYKIKVILQEVPSKLAVVSRPLKERFIMSPDGGKIESSVSPQVKIIFPSNTLNTSTKVVLQVQNCDDSLLQPTDQTYASPIVSLDPPTQLAKPITINIPCPWLRNEDKSMKKNLRLLAWLPLSPRKSTGDRVDCEWRDITSNTALTIVGDNASFTTTEFTKYWLLQTNSIETLLKRAPTLQQTLSVAPYSARIYVYGKPISANQGEIRVFLVSDEPSFRKMIQHYRNITELAKSDVIPVYETQSIHVHLSGNITAADSQNLKLAFSPLRSNKLTIKTNLISGDGTANGRLTFIGSLRKNASEKSSTLCNLDVQFDAETMRCSTTPLPEDTVNDEAIQLIGSKINQSWTALSDELDLTKRDKQAVVDISSGKYDQPSIKLLQFWRAKSPANATYKALFDALKYSGHDTLADELFSLSPNEFSRELLPRNSPQTNGSSTPPSPTPLVNGHHVDVYENGVIEQPYAGLSRSTQENVRANSLSLSSLEHLSDEEIHTPNSSSERLDQLRRENENTGITIHRDDLVVLPSSTRQHDGDLAAGVSDIISDSPSQTDHHKHSGFSSDSQTEPNDTCMDFPPGILVDTTIVTPVQPGEAPSEESEKDRSYVSCAVKEDVVDLTALDDLVPDHTHIDTIGTEPSAYELSWLRREQETEAIGAEDVDDRVKSKETITEDVIHERTVGDVHAELDVSCLDWLDDGYEADANHWTVVHPDDDFPSAESQITTDDEESLPDDLKGSPAPSTNSPFQCVSSLDDKSSSRCSERQEFTPGEDSPINSSTYDAECVPNDALEDQENREFSPSHLTERPLSEVVSVGKHVSSSQWTAMDVTIDVNANDTLTETVVSRQCSTVTKITSSKKVSVSEVKETTTQLNNKEVEEDGDVLIKRMFGNQSSVMEFFDDKKSEAKDDYSAYGTQV